MNRFKSAIKVLLGLAGVAGLAYGLVIGLQKFFTAISQLSPQLSATILGSLATVLGGAVGVILNQRSLKKREIAETQREQKIKVYKNFMKNVIMKTLKHGSQDNLEEFVEGELQETYYDVTGDLIAWGSPEFIKSYEKFREAGQKETEEPEKILLYLDQTLRAMRKDLGHSDWTIEEGGLIKLFLSDPEEIDKIK